MTDKGGRYDVHAEITNQIITTIEAGAENPIMPWHRINGAAGLPKNVKTEKPYNGINILALWVSAIQHRFGSNVWGTFKHWRDLETPVRKGEKGTRIIFYKEYPGEDENGEPVTRRAARGFVVFNADQVDGYANPNREGELKIDNPAERIEVAEQFVSSTQADIRHGGQNAFFSPHGDYIQMPPAEIFTGSATSTPTECYYSTLFHELTHWTGTSSRCDRHMKGRFGDNAYAMEELVAEIGAAFLCVGIGITPEPRRDHADYIAHWLGVMKEDKRAIFSAAAKASQAVIYLSGDDAK